MVFTTILLILGFGAILTSNFQFTFYFGLLGGFTVLVALFADLFVTPSLFLLIKPKIKRWQMLEDKWKKVNEKLTKLFGKNE